MSSATPDVIKAKATKKAQPSSLPAPSNLQGYIDRVGSLLDKSFRDDLRILVAARGRVVASVTRPLVEAEGRPQDAKHESRAATVPIPNYFIFSPRFSITNGNAIDGKLKVSTKMHIDGVCGVYTRFFADTLGRFTTKWTLSNIQNTGVVLNATLQSPGLLYDADSGLRKSIVGVVAEVDKGSYYGRVGSNWSTNGERRFTADACIRLANVHIGAGMDRYMSPPSAGGGFSGSSTGGDTSHRSFTSSGRTTPRTQSDQSSFMNYEPVVDATTTSINTNNNANSAEAYIGMGCFGPSWSLSALLYRSQAKWSELHFTAFQSFNKRVIVAATYQLDIHYRETEFNLGIFRRFHLPYWGQSFIGACKVSNTGMGSLLVDMEFDEHTKIGVVSRHQMLLGGRPSFGLIASVGM